MIRASQELLVSARLVACAQASQEALMVKTAAWWIARAEVPKIRGDFSTGEHTHIYYIYIWMYIYVGNRWR